jgi:hypothetical protein
MTDEKWSNRGGDKGYQDNRLSAEESRRKQAERFERRRMEDEYWWRCVV